MKFNEFNFHADLAKGVKIAGFKEPSPIQELAIPIIASGSDMVGQAHTGTGKTAAFGLPMMDKIAKGEIERALVITPTESWPHKLLTSFTIWDVLQVLEH